MVYILLIVCQIIIYVWLYKMTCIQWSPLWKLNFNESKCAVVTFSPRSTASPPNQLYLINCHTVTRLKCHKDLGILLSHDLSMKQHYEFLSSKAYKILGLLRRTFSRDSSIHAIIKKSYTFHLLNLNSLIVHLFGAQCF